MALYLLTSQRGEADTPQPACLPSPLAFGNGTCLGLRHPLAYCTTSRPLPAPPRHRYHSWVPHHHP